MLDVTGPLQMFAGVNDELGRRVYELVIAAPKRGPFKTSSGVSLVAGLAIADVSPAKCRASDTVMAAGGDPGLRRALESGEIAALIKAASRRGSRIVSVCTGTFFLAAAGLLMGAEQQLIGTMSSAFVDFDPRSTLILKRSIFVTGMSGRRQASRPASI
jgi:transcriptional regulator GlxA family with amidase domain